MLPPAMVSSCDGCAATGKAMHTCAENVDYCPDARTLSNMRTMSIWAEGVAGSIHLEVREISGYGCASRGV